MWFERLTSLTISVNPKKNEQNVPESKGREWRTEKEKEGDAEEERRSNMSSLAIIDS